MLKLDNLELTDYELQITDDEIRKYPILEISYGLESLYKVTDPTKIREMVQELFGLPDVTSFQATAIIKDFYKYIDQDEISEKLNEVFGQGLFSPTTSESALETSNDSVQENTLDVTNA